MKKCFMGLFVIVQLFFLAGCRSEPSRIPAVVERVVDGDTLKVKIGKRDETVRLLLVDAPESVHPTKPVEPFGEEASEYVKKWLPPGTNVKLELDVRERDRYGRLLAYVWIKDAMINEGLLAKGYARVYVLEPNVKHLEAFRDIQETARKKKLGIWSMERDATDRRFDD